MLFNVQINEYKIQVRCCRARITTVTVQDTVERPKEERRIILKVHKGTVMKCSITLIQEFDTLQQQ